MTHSPTPTELLALKTANAALLNSPDSFCDMVATVVFALGSAQLLQSPETAAELARLRDRVAELEAAAYGDAPVRLLEPAAQIRHLRDSLAAQMHRADTLNWICKEQRQRADAADARVAELEALTPARYQTCRECGAGYEYGKPCSTCEFHARIAAAQAAQPEHSRLSRDLPEVPHA